MDQQVGSFQNCLDESVPIAGDVLIFPLNFVILHWAGLGSNMDDICGKDWVYGGGDHGDAGNQGISPCFFRALSSRCFYYHFLK